MTSPSSANSQPGPHLERVDPRERRDLEGGKHWARYDWVAQFLPAGRVLDCACGSGFGSVLLCERGAREVVAVDNSPEALAHARRHSAGPGVRYLQADALQLDAAGLAPFDLIVCLETAEHVADPRRLFGIFHQLLNPDGVLAVSVPNDTYLRAENPHHLWRAEFATVRGWLAERFRHVHSYAEFQVIGSAVWPLVPMPAHAAAEPTVPVALRILDQPVSDVASGFVFACGQQPPPAVGGVAAELLDGVGYLRELERVRDELYAESQRLSQAWETHHAHIGNQATRISVLEQELERASAEGRRIAHGWALQKTHIEDQAARIRALEQELALSTAETRRLAGGWEKQKAHIAAQEKRIQELMAELTRLAAELRKHTPT